MLVTNGQPDYEGADKFSPFDIWEKGGLTEHLGGIYATRRLLNRCHLATGQEILDIGCGTVFTACYLARNHQVQVSASTFIQAKSFYDLLHWRYRTWRLSAIPNL